MRILLGMIGKTFCKSAQRLTVLALVSMSSSSPQNSNAATTESFSNRFYTSTLITHAERTQNWMPLLNATSVAIACREDAANCAERARAIMLRAKDRQAEYDALKEMSSKRLGFFDGANIVKNTLIKYRTSGASGAVSSGLTDISSLEKIYNSYRYYIKGIQLGLPPSVAASNMEKNFQNESLRTLGVLSSLDLIPTLRVHALSSKDPALQTAFQQLSDQFHKAYGVDLTVDPQFLLRNDKEFIAIEEIQKLTSNRERTIDELRLKLEVQKVGLDSLIQRQFDKEKAQEVERQISSFQLQEARLAMLSETLHASLPLLSDSPKTQGLVQAAMETTAAFNSFRLFCEAQTARAGTDPGSPGAAQMETLAIGYLSGGFSSFLGAVSIMKGLMEPGKEDTAVVMARLILKAIEAFREDMNERLVRLNEKVDVVNRDVISAWKGLSRELDILHEDLSKRLGSVGVILTKHSIALGKIQSDMHDLSHFVKKQARDQVWSEKSKLEWESNKYLHTGAALNRDDWTRVHNRVSRISCLHLSHRRRLPRQTRRQRRPISMIRSDNGRHW